MSTHRTLGATDLLDSGDERAGGRLAFLHNQLLDPHCFNNDTTYQSLSSRFKSPSDRVNLPDRRCRIPYRYRCSRDQIVHKVTSACSYSSRQGDPVIVMVVTGNKISASVSSTCDRRPRYKAISLNRQYHGLNICGGV
jgi:hypothetical protein